MKHRPRPDDICCRPCTYPPQATEPHAPPLITTSVWRCHDTDQADQLLQGTLEGYVYQRDRHPNADMFVAKCAELHAAECAAATSSGMSALSLAILSQLQPGDHVLVSHQLYGRSRQLLTGEASQWGLTSTLVDTSDLPRVRAALTRRTRMIVAETISNPALRVADIGALAEIADSVGAALLIDNTFATPILCRPLAWGAAFVLESITKMINGHSDVMLGLLCGRAATWQRVANTLSAWGLASSPFDCWLALRGMATLHLRMERACANALAAAEFLASHSQVERVDYPGLTSHPDHALAKRLFLDQFGSMVTLHLRGGRAAADAFIRAAREIPFCPSLGEVSTTLSHPESTSHRGLSAAQRQELGISGGTIRLSVGVESSTHILQALDQGLSALAG